MAGRSHGIHNNPNATNYVNKKGIHELFEAIMTALMVHKPDDHIAFIRECLDKVQQNPTRLRWDHFLATSNNIKPILPPKSSIVRSRSKPLPPVRSLNVAAKPTNVSNRQSSIKVSPLPPIDDNKKNSPQIPIVFILSSTVAAKLCSRLLDRYDDLTYLSINDVANIDEDDSINLKKHENRFGRVQQALAQRRSSTRGFLLAGHVDESNFYEKWQEYLGRIELVVILSSGSQITSHQSLDVIQIDSSNDFDIILADAVRALDGILPHKTLTSRSIQSSESKSNSFSLPIIFCIDTHRVSSKDIEITSDSTQRRIMEHSSIDDEFDTTNDESEVEINNSFIYALCERLAEQFSFKHIHYGDCNRTLLDFEQLKATIIESMSTCTGYIIEHFPISFDDFQRFQKEVGPCSALIYIGDSSPREKSHDDCGIIIEKCRKEDKVIYVDYRMEVDEIFEDLKKDILSRI